MRTALRLFVVFAAGCGSSAAPAPAETPLTVEAWKDLPAADKYKIETFERLKLGTPKLQEPREWEKFHRDVVVPSKKK